MIITCTFAEELARGVIAYPAYCALGAGASAVAAGMKAAASGFKDERLELDMVRVVWSKCEK